MVRCLSQSLMNIGMDRSKSNGAQPVRLPPNNPPSSPSLDHDDSFLDDDDTNFDLQNEIYRLRSQYNDLELDKTKMEMAYETNIRELKKKYQVLERYLAERNEKDERERGAQSEVEQLRGKCRLLAEENDELKHRVKEANRLTPSFPQTGTGRQQDEDMLQELIKAEDRAQSLVRQLAQSKLQNEQLQRQNSQLQQQAARVKKERQSLRQEKEEYARVMVQQTEEHHTILIRHKDKTIEELKKQKINLSMQVEEATHALENAQEAQKRQSKTQFMNELKTVNGKLQEKELRCADLQQQKEIWGLQRERAKEERGRWEQKAAGMERERKELLERQKQLQDQLYKKEIEVEEAKTNTFSDKIEAKKQLGIVMRQLEEEKTQAVALQEEKTQENNRLKTTVLSINQENEQLKQMLSTLQKQVQGLQRQSRQWQAQKEGLETEIQQVRTSNMRIMEAAQGANNRAHEEEVASLRADMYRLESQLEERNGRIAALSTSKEQLQQEVQMKVDLIQLAKIEKEEERSRVSAIEEELSRLRNTQASKDTVIRSLEEEIKAAKDDVKQLQEANQEYIEQSNTMKSVQNELMRMRQELEREKRALQQNKRQQERLRLEQERALSSKRLVSQQSIESGDNMRSMPSPHSLSRVNTSKEEQQYYEEELDKIKKEVVKAVENNKELQVRLNEAEAEVDRRGFDLRVKQEEIEKLKSRPQQGNNFEVIAEANKKSQFNAVMLENKILELEKEVTGIRMVKEKEVEEFKKAYRKKLEDKFAQELKKANAYIAELKKKHALLSDKLEAEMMKNTQVALRVDQLEKENYEAKYEYSQSLSENNQLLQRIKKLEEAVAEGERARKALGGECRSMMQEYEKLSRVHGDNVSMLGSANEQVKRLSGLLVEREGEIRSLQGERASNASFSTTHPYAHSRVIDKISNLGFRDQAKEEAQQPKRWSEKAVIRTKI